MYIDGIRDTGLTSLGNASSVYKKQEEGTSFLPFSWNKDTVSFSPEAMAAQEAATAEKQAVVQNRQDEQAEEAEENDAVAAFSKYMKKASGKEGTPANIEEQIKALKEKLKTLNAQLSQVAMDKNLPEETRNSKVETVQNEIGQVIAQISELMSQSVDEDSAESA